VRFRPPRVETPRRAIASMAALLTLALAAPARPEAASAPAPVADRGLALQVVHQARDFEDHGAPARALGEWRRLRGMTPRDGDLELALALNEARAGQLDSAAARLADHTLSDAAADTLPSSRFRSYAVDRDTVYVNGRFDGWHWYVWRARTEVAMARGRWDEAVAAARRCVAARPTAGKEWLLLAVCAGRAGLDDEARGAARQAIAFDGTLPEAHYLAGVWAWRDGRRPEAQARFRAAVAADSALQAAGMALVRSRLPGSPPDSLPASFLTGVRSVGILTSPRGPKMEDLPQYDRIPILSHRVDPAFPDSVKAPFVGKRVLLWLFVDDAGHVVLNDLPWATADQYPVPVLTELLKHFAAWQFTPAQTKGVPSATWVDVLYAFPR
jgi:tetratricopeptide (TPR) repeat protein